MKRLALIAVAALSVACSSTKPEEGATQQPVATTPVLSKPVVNQRPKARIYKTNGDYRLNVPVTLADGNITSYPDVADIIPAMLPIELADGYILDRRGITSNTAFTTYTYEAYSSLEQTPSVDVLKDAIIPEATVVEIIQLPFEAQTAVADTARCNQLIRSGLPGCTTIMQIPSISR